MNNNGNGENDKNGKKRNVDEREEWMINPGEDRAISGQILAYFRFILGLF